jgi:hypothetical protein
VWPIRSRTCRLDQPKFPPSPSLGVCSSFPANRSKVFFGQGQVGELDHHLWPNPIHAQIQWRAEPARYSGLVIGSPCTCSICYGNQCGRDIAPTADRDADPHALESSLHWLRHRYRSSCLAAGERHDANITRRARGTLDRVSWCRDGDGLCDANNAAACCAVPSLDWLCCDFGGGPVVCNWPSGLLPRFCVQF